MLYYPLKIIHILFRVMLASTINCPILLKRMMKSLEKTKYLILRERSLC